MNWLANSHVVADGSMRKPLGVEVQETSSPAEPFRTQSVANAAGAVLGEPGNYPRKAGAKHLGHS